MLGSAGETAEGSNSIMSRICWGRICCAIYSGLHQKPPVLHITTARRQGHCGKEEDIHNLTYEYSSRRGVVKVGIWETKAK